MPKKKAERVDIITFRVTEAEREIYDKFIKRMKSEDEDAKASHFLRHAVFTCIKNNILPPKEKKP